MADNSAQNGTDTIATDDLTTLNGGAISGVKVQRVKVGYGADAAFTDADTTTPLPIHLRTTGGSALAAFAGTLEGNSPGFTALAVNSVAHMYDGTLHQMVRGDTTAGLWTQLKAALPAGTNSIGTTLGPTLTKGTQGSTGYSVQQIKDAGRAIVNAATAIAGVTAVTTEALMALNISRDGAATASATSHAVTSGKRWRITGLMVSGISTAAAVFSARVSLRMNPSGAATASSPIIATVGLTQQAAALAQAGDSAYMPFTDGIEVSGTMQVGISHVANVVTGTLWVSLIGYEY